LFRWAKGGQQVKGHLGKTFCQFFGSVGNGIGSFSGEKEIGQNGQLLNAGLHELNHLIFKTGSNGPEGSGAAQRLSQSVDGIVTAGTATAMAQQ
jgi:hypothetical protein